MSKITPHDNSSFYNDDALMKKIILDTACRVAAIEELLQETHHMCEYTSKHDMSDILIKKSAIESRANSIKTREPYASGYKALNAEGVASENSSSYLRAFTRNLIET